MPYSLRTPTGVEYAAKDVPATARRCQLLVQFLNLRIRTAAVLDSGHCNTSLLQKPDDRFARRPTAHPPIQPPLGEGRGTKSPAGRRE